MRTLGIDIGGTSVKLACLEEGQVLWQSQSHFYLRPATSELIAALQSADSGRAEGVERVGVCVPGLMNAERTMVTLSVNVPGLVNVPIEHILTHGIGNVARGAIVSNDAIAAAVDVQEARKLSGRLMAIALGTGVGMAVLDNGTPLRVDGDSSGHIGQVDVSIEGHPVIGPDGGAGSLEGYVGAAALKKRFGDDLTDAFAAMTATDPAILALVRAIRIGHAIYRPNHICLLGGVATRLRHLLGDIRAAVETNLTSIADRSGTFTIGDDDFHAARGMARLAARRRVAHSRT